MITCPNCQTENQSGKKFCRNCGHPLPADPRATQLSSPLPAGAASWVMFTLYFELAA